MSVAAQTLRPPSKTLMLLEGRAFHELGAFLGALPLLSLAPEATAIPCWCCPASWPRTSRRGRCARS